jgi:hypothetical protein
MKHPKRLDRKYKIFLADKGYSPKDFLFERETEFDYIFYNVHTKMLFPLSK